MSDFSLVNVYEIASDINNQFQQLTSIYGKEKFFVLMRMVLKALEILEEQTIKLEHDNTEINDLNFTIERLQRERKLKADERIKFEKECEQIDESWHNEVQSKTKRIELLEGDLKKLKKLLSSNRNFNETEVKENQPSSDIQVLYRESKRLKQQAKEASDKINLLACDCEMIEKEKNLLKQQRDELKMRLSELSDKFQEMMIDRNLWMAQCQETVNQLRSSNEKGSSIRKEVNINERVAGFLPTQQKKLSTFNKKDLTCEYDRKKNNEDEDNNTDFNDVQGPVNKEPEEKLDSAIKKSKLSDFFTHFLKWSKTKDVQASQFTRANVDLNRQHEDTEDSEFFEKSPIFYLKCNDFDKKSNVISSIENRIDFHSNQDITCISSNSRSPKKSLIEHISHLDDPSHLNNPSTLQSVFYNLFIPSDVPFKIASIPHIP